MLRNHLLRNLLTITRKSQPFQPLNPPPSNPRPLSSSSSSTAQKPPPPKNNNNNDNNDLETLLATPSWSVKSLFAPTTPTLTTSTSSNSTGSGGNSPAVPEGLKEPEITQTQLHHLLRLSALPLPTSAAEERRMIADLRAQLRFVRAMGEVETEGVEGLVGIRDESVEGEGEGMVGLEEMRGELGREEVVGVRGRIVRRNEGTGKGEGEEGKRGEGGGLDLLDQAPRRLGRYVVVDTAND